MITVEHDPREVGVDPARLARIDTLLAGYVDDRRLAGTQVRVSRRGRTVHSQTYGLRDREAGLAVEPDTLWRIYSMTKPVTAVVAMQLVEHGRLRLNDEVSRWLPDFADMRVLVGGSLDKPTTVPATEPIRVWHLLTHTAGLTYAFTRSSLLDELYRAAGADPIADPGSDLAEMCRRWGSLPLLFAPGSAWNYSVATDVLGRPGRGGHRRRSGRGVHRAGVHAARDERHPVVGRRAGRGAAGRALRARPGRAGGPSRRAGGPGP